MPAQFEGFGELAAKLKGLSDPKEIAKVLRKGVTQAMAEPRARAIALIPEGKEIHKTYLGREVAPGFARRNVRLKIGKSRSGLMAFGILGVNDEAYYAVQYLELGTSKMPAHPWLRPAFAASRDPMVRMIGKGLNDWIIDLAKRKGGDRGAQLQSNAEQFAGSFD